jgi:hypothetical protein
MDSNKQVLPPPSSEDGNRCSFQKDVFCSEYNMMDTPSEI